MEPSIKVRFLRRTALLAFAVSALATMGASLASGQAAATVLSTGEIPKDSYKTWSLFLVCNQDWLAPEKSKDLYQLYERFKRFGRAIGDDNLAVWFWKSTKSIDDPKLAENVDVERSIRFCKAYELKPSSGPYLLITGTYPDPSSPHGDHAHFELGKMTSTEISALLGGLTDKLVSEGRVPHDDMPPPLKPFWIGLLEDTQQVIGKFGCAWVFKVETGLLNAELRACENR